MTWVNDDNRKVWVEPVTQGVTVHLGDDGNPYCVPHSAEATMSDYQDEMRAFRAFVHDLFEGSVEASADAAATFLLELEEDIADLFTIPPERQERYLKRMRNQALGVMELLRIKAIDTTNRAIVASFIAGIRLIRRAALA